LGIPATFPFHDLHCNQANGNSVLEKNRKVFCFSYKTQFNKSKKFMILKFHKRRKNQNQIFSTVWPQKNVHHQKSNNVPNFTSIIRKLPVYLRLSAKDHQSLKSLF